VITKAAIFDRGGVLAEFDIEASIALVTPLVPLSVHELFDLWQQWGQSVGFPSSVEEEINFLKDFWDHIGDKLNLPQEQRDELRQIDYTKLMRPFPEVRSVLLETRRLGIRTGVLSNFQLASLEASLEAVGLVDLIDVVCAATVIGVAKPEPESYLYIARALSVRPDECLFFDNKPHLVDGAHAVGMRAYLVDRSRTQHAISEGVVCDLTALPALAQVGH
jgi:putative hydrolase of the HAD superfamily